MTRFVLAGAFLGAMTIATAARAEVVAPDAGLQAALGAVNVTIYYHPLAAGYQVVTTASTDQPDSVIRFVSTLMPGQDAIISVPRGVGDRLEFQRPTT